jgi:PTH1 family peptidyl-tRNA hydrolase
VVGLGNPGSEYAATRHNAGFLVLDVLAGRWGVGRRRERFRGQLAEGRLEGEHGRLAVALLWPRTFMNDAGRSVSPARGALKVPLERLVVVYDEIDLPFGEVRSRLGGGHAGHNGMRSLKRELGASDFWRVRIGVGRPSSTDPEIVSSYVLSRFSQPQSEVEQLIERAAQETERLIVEDGSP